MCTLFETSSQEYNMTSSKKKRRENSKKENRLFPFSSLAQKECFHAACNHGAEDFFHLYASSPHRNHFCARIPSSFFQRMRVRACVRLQERVALKQVFDSCEVPKAAILAAKDRGMYHDGGGRKKKIAKL